MGGGSFAAAFTATFGGSHQADGQRRCTLGGQRCGVYHLHLPAVLCQGVSAASTAQTCPNDEGEAAGCAIFLLQNQELLRQVLRPKSLILP